MKLLANPIVWRMALVLFAGVFSFVVGRLMIKHMRQSIVEEALPTDKIISESNLPLHTYHAVIQELKQQKHELQSTQDAERRRAKTSENISLAILSHLSSGVMFFGTNGLVRQANRAAKQLLGFASPLGLSADELFRGALVRPSAQISLPEAIRASVRNYSPSLTLTAEITTPQGDTRVLEITISSVAATSGEVLGAACLLTDKTEVSLIRREQDLRGEMSAEMALELRNSLTTISGYARQLSISRDAELARQLAADIASEASHLDHTIGGFLAGAKHAAPV